jgi:signal transduction histidine kinase/CheY-like chemotaxis protein
MTKPPAACFARLDSLYLGRSYFAAMKARLLAAFNFLLLVFIPLNIVKLLWVQPPELATRFVLNLFFGLAGLGSLFWLYKGRQELAGNWLVLSSALPIHLTNLLWTGYAEPLAVAIQIFVFDVVILLLALVFASRRMAVAVLLLIMACHLAFWAKALQDPMPGSMAFAADTMTRDGLIAMGFLFCLGITLMTMMEAAHRRRDEALRETRLLNENLEKLVSERTRDLEEATRRAHDASRAKSDFLANMSHEIRTPLHGIVASSELLLGRADLSPQAADQARLIADSGDLLLKVLGDVLDFSRIESGQLSLETHRFELIPLVRDTAALVASRAKTGGVQLIVTWAPGLPEFLEGDSYRLRQILLNLLSNAIKFTPAGGQVEITVSAENQTQPLPGIRFEVRDTGIGMDEPARERIFERFAQADVSTSRLYGGTGLGLAISDRLVRMMGGKLQVTSTPGQGSVFFFTLPLPTATGGPDPLTGHRDASRSLGLQVLVAEDNAINRKILGAQLEKLGCRFTMTCNGREALAVLSQGPLPDVILMDCDMPELDGWEATRQLRSWEKDAGATSRQIEASRLPVVALTAATLPEERQRCFAAGMNSYLPKPVKLAGLAEALAPFGLPPSPRAS